MSCNYAESLSHYEHKGKLGLPEIFDSVDEVEKKCHKLAEFLKTSTHTVVHTGAGVSTSAGIPDFRGPNGVWTLEKEGKKPSVSVNWDDAKPTKTHLALTALYKAGFVSYIVTQNIDGLHLRSGIPRRCLAELHGNFYVDQCSKCHRQFVRQEAAATVAQKTQGVSCPGQRGGRRCRGKLHDTILDWEAALPDNDLELAHLHSCCADLSLCLGTTLQIIPSGNLPVHTKKRGGKLVICNLQPTKQDKHADFIIHSYVDQVMTRVLEILKIPLPDYDTASDPVLITRNTLSRLGYPLCASRKDADIPQLPGNFEAIEWTIPERWIKDQNLIQKSKSRKIIKAKKNSPVKEKCVSNSCKKVKLDINDQKINTKIRKEKADVSRTCVASVTQVGKKLNRKDSVELNSISERKIKLPSLKSKKDICVKSEVKSLSQSSTKLSNMESETGLCVKTEVRSLSQSSTKLSNMESDTGHCVKTVVNSISQCSTKLPNLESNSDLNVKTEDNDIKNELSINSLKSEPASVSNFHKGNKGSKNSNTAICRDDMHQNGAVNESIESIEHETKSTDQLNLDVLKT